MIQKSLLELQNDLDNYGVLISFSGRFTQGIIEELGEAVKKYLEIEDRPKNDIFNVFAVFIEQTQNIKNYSTSKEGSPVYNRIVSSGIVTIGKSENGYFVCSGNQIENQDVPMLSEKIENLVSLDKDALKKLYKEQIKKELPPGSTSAGVGLIHMARKASLPLEYSVTPLDGDFSFFVLKVIV